MSIQQTIMLTVYYLIIKIMDRTHGMNDLKLSHREDRPLEKVGSFFIFFFILCVVVPRWLCSRIEEKNIWG